MDSNTASVTPKVLLDLVHGAHYAAYSWGFDAGKVGRHIDTTDAMNKSDAALHALLDAIKAASASRAELLEANTRLAGALDMVRETLQGGNVQDLLHIINEALRLHRATKE
jgi:hypothetical protein